MGNILKLLTGPFGSYALIGMALITIVSSMYGYAQHQAAARYRIERNTTMGENVRLIETVKSKEGIITDMTDALNAWQRRAEDSAKLSTEAGERAATYQTQLNAARSRLRALTEIDRGNPKCEALLEIDLAGACTGHADRVRKWAAGDLQRTSGEGPDSGRSAH